MDGTTTNRNIPTRIGMDAPWASVSAGFIGTLAVKVDHTHRALEALCRSYWYPIYAFVRRRGSSSHDAEDLTQSFFHHILTRGA